MKYITIFIIILSQFQLFSQTNFSGEFKSYYGETIIINNDSTFKFTSGYPYRNWISGKWNTLNDTIFFKFIPIYDTLKIYDHVGALIISKLTLSCDEYPNTISEKTNFTQKYKPDSVIYSYQELQKINGNIIEKTLCLSKQDFEVFPSKLFFTEDRIYKLNCYGEPIKKKYRSIQTNKKFKSGYFKIEE